MGSDFLYVIGIMSGTSLDGIDFVYVKFDKKENSNFNVLATTTVAYSKKWKATLQNAISLPKEKLTELDVLYGELLATEINAFRKKFDIEEVDFIASHGHTVLHQPDNGITLQIGNGQVIAKKTNLKAVCDFRTQDVQLGGQGAPLVPIGDELLFSKYDFCINLGGFSNISYKEKTQRIAFDICPVNIVLNFYVQKLGFDYDANGEIAKQGIINTELLAVLNALSFYQKTPPKSLGLEWVQKEIFPLIDTYEKEIPTILRTFVEHIAIQIGTIIQGNKSVLITGGGAFNSFLMERIAYYAKTELVLPKKEIIDYKEALIFAFLGKLRVEGKVNCLQSVTGASENHSSGVIFYP